MVLWSAETGRVSEDMANVMELTEDAALECLVRCCIEHLKKNGNVYQIRYPPEEMINYQSYCIGRKIRCGCKVDGRVWKECYSNKIERPSCCGNLYALHIRCCSKSNWRLQYVGKSKPKDLNSRLRQHLVHVSAGTSSKLWIVAHKVSKGYQIGVSCAKVVVPGKSDEVNMALAGYVENRIIEIEKLTGQWNERIG